MEKKVELVIVGLLVAVALLAGKLVTSGLELDRIEEQLQMVVQQQEVLRQEMLVIQKPWFGDPFFWPVASESDGLDYDNVTWEGPRVSPVALCAGEGETIIRQPKLVGLTREYNAIWLVGYQENHVVVGVFAPKVEIDGVIEEFDYCYVGVNPRLVEPVYNGTILGWGDDLSWADIVEFYRQEWVWEEN